METSILIARIASVVYLSAALGWMVSRDHYHRLPGDLFKNAALTYFMGFTAVVLGSLMAHYHNIWSRDWTVLITLLAWLALVKGILIIVLPGFVQSCSQLIFQGRGFQFFPYLALVIGIVFGYFGFVH